MSKGMDTKGQEKRNTAGLAERSGRIEYLDVARGMAIIMLVLFHVLGETSLVFHHFAATTGLHVFLFVSGYFFRGFDWKKNLKKLVLPYILLLVVVRLYWDLALGTIWPGQVKDLAKQILLGYTIDELWQGSGVFVGISWFLPMLVAARIVYLVICRLEKENYVVRGLLAIIVSCAGIVIGNQGIKLPWSLDVAMATAFFMYLGDLTHRYQESVTAYMKKWWLVLAMLITWGICVHCFGYGELPFRSYPYGMTFLLVSTLSMGVVFAVAYMISCHLRYVKKGLCMAGKYSFVILCAHVLDKSCLVHSPETNIFLLAAWELFLACSPVLVICLYQWLKKKRSRRAV